MIARTRKKCRKKYDKLLYEFDDCYRECIEWMKIVERMGVEVDYRECEKSCLGEISDEA